jgi:hypothetical protein
MNSLLFLLLVALPVAQAQASLELSGCSSAREYVTTLEYLRKKEDLKLPDLEARKIADQVSKGCTDAAERFIRVSELLIRAQLSVKDAIAQALALSQRPREVAEGFVSAFQLAYSSERLDLRVQSAVDLARAVSQEFDGDALVAEKDFRQVVELCTSERGFPLSKEDCAALGLRVARAGGRIGESVGATFVTAFRELVARKNAPLIGSEAIRTAEEIAAQGDQGLENFRVAYRYALSQSGLKATEPEAYAFARQMVARTRGLETKLQSEPRKKAGAP